MEIEFSPTQPLLAVSPGSLAPSAAASTGGGAGADSLDASGSLNDKLNALPLSRPDKVSEGKLLVARTHYPPNDLVDRIATLLAIKLGQ